MSTCLNIFFANNNSYTKINWRKNDVTQEELRQKLIEHTRMGTQKYISTQVGIDCATLSKFKTGKIDLYPDLSERLHSFFEEK